MNWDVGFVTYTMQEIGVPLPRLLEVYDQLFKARVRKIVTHRTKRKKKGGGEGENCLQLLSEFLAGKVNKCKIGIYLSINFIAFFTLRLLLLFFFSC